MKTRNCYCGYKVTAEPQDGDSCPNCGVNLVTNNLPIASWNATEILERCAPDATQRQKRGALRMWNKDMHLVRYESIGITDNEFEVRDVNLIVGIELTDSGHVPVLYTIYCGDRVNFPGASQCASHTWVPKTRRYWD